MNEHAIQHIPDSPYCFPVDDARVILRLRTMKGESLRLVSVIYACKYEFQTTRFQKELQKKYSDRLFDYYEAVLSLEDVRLAYVFYLETPEGSYYFSEDGLTTEYRFELGFYNFFQLPYIHRADRAETVEWMKSAVFYEIFVDRFCKGGRGKDESYINLPWGELPGVKSFAGGDLEGIRKKLGYLKELGINALYLTPLFTSISNHKYDTINYRQIDPHFGTETDFKRLVEDAHSLGMKIVLDAVFNHCSSLMEQFQDVLKNGKKSPFFDWFVIHGEEAQSEPCNYECFASCSYMPKINMENKEARSFFLDIACHWIREYDIDGWRLDVSDEISHDFWREFRREVKALKPDCVIIGENWHNAYPFLMGDQYDSIMNYAFTKACLDYFAFDALDSKGFADKLNELYMRNKKPVNDMMLNLLDTHDTHRFYTETARDRNKLLAAMAVEVCFPGAPCVYYGTEIALEGGYDPDSRRTFDWEEEHWDKELWKTVRKLLALKKEKSLQDGGLSVREQEGLFCLERKGQKETILLYYNKEDRPIKPEGVKEMGQPLVSVLYDVKACLLQPGGFVIIRKGEMSE